MTGVFPSVLKTVKVVPVFIKDSKLDFSKYHPISLLPNTEKKLEKFIYNRVRLTGSWFMIHDEVLNFHDKIKR